MKDVLRVLLPICLAFGVVNFATAKVSSSFAINFISADEQKIPEDTAAGFAKGDYDQPTTWFNFSGANGKQSFIVNGASYDVTWTASGTYTSSTAVDASIDAKLLHNYLDDIASWNGRTKAALKVTGLPADKKYTLALILSGDGNGAADYNNRFSPVWINGEVYAYSTTDDVTSLVKGDATKDITYWGSRSKATAAAGLAEGQNVMIVEGLSDSTLTITSAMDSREVSRLTIAGFQIWITDEDAPAAPAVTAPTDSDVISVNFDQDKGSAADGAGLVPAKHWHNTAGASGTIDSLTVVNGDNTFASGASLTYTSKNTWSYTSNITDAFLKGYLDDGTHDGVDGATITASNIPFETYSVIVYMATDTAGQFKPLQINGALYAGSATLTLNGYADVKPNLLQNSSVCNWGACQTATAAYGTNVLRVDGLTGDLTIQAGNDQTYNGIRNRGGIAAIQIVNTGDSIFSNVQKIDWTEQPADQLKVSALQDLTKDIIELTLADGAVLIVDEIKADKVLNIISTGAVTIKVTNLDITQAQLNGMINTAGVTGTVTNNYRETNGYIVGDVTYPLVYRGGTDGWSTAANWATGYRTNGEEIYWITYAGTVVPGVPNSNVWNLGLVDGDLIGDAITADEDGYKVVNTPTLEGWALKMTVANGVHVKIPTLNKLQGNCVIRVDGTSKITVTDKGNGNNGSDNSYHIDAENGLVFENMPMPGGTAYLGSTGSITTGTFANNQTIGGVKLVLGDSSLTGRKLITRTLYTFTSGTNFTVAEGAVTTDVEGVAATAAASLQKVGDYKFAKTDTAYQVQYVAYAETDELDPINIWNGAINTAWETAGNWTNGVPEAGDDVIITVATDTTITIPDDGVSVGSLIVNGSGTLTIAGGKITANEIIAQGNLVASESTLALAPMDISEGVVVEYATTTTVADPDSIGNYNHVLSLKAMTGEGTFVKTGAGVIALFATAVQPAIVVEEGSIYVRETPSTAMNIAAKAGAEIRLAAWHHNFANAANKITLEGGAQLTLANGANVSGTITIENAAETSAKICGSSFNDSTISASITGSGKVEFADGGVFGEGKYPCDYATTFSGVISGDLEVIVSDAQSVTFSAANTFTGGINILSGKTVKITNSTALGRGVATIGGTLIVGSNGLGSKVTGAGTIRAVEDNGVVNFVNGHAIVPAYGKVLTISGSISGTPKFDVAALVSSSDRRLNLLKVDNIENLPAKFTANNFLATIPTGWYVVSSADGLGWVLKYKKFFIRIR